MKFKNTIILFLLLIIGFELKSQSLNDYGTISSGNYTNINIWRQWDGVGWNIIPDFYFMKMEK